jgi:hypothetical protein
MTTAKYLPSVGNQATLHNPSNSRYPVLCLASIACATMTAWVSAILELRFRESPIILNATFRTDTTRTPL